MESPAKRLRVGTAGSAALVMLPILLAGWAGCAQRLRSSGLFGEGTESSAAGSGGAGGSVRAAAEDEDEDEGDEKKEGVGEGGSNGSATGTSTSTGYATTSIGSGPASSSAASTGSGIDGGDCCNATGGASCDDPGIAQCVCGTDPYCCTTSWDSSCVDLVDTLGCGQCGSSSSSSSGTGGGSNDCCAAVDTPGCADAAVAECVCSTDSFCCSFAWDSTCVDEVKELGCGGDCGPPVDGVGDCCDAQSSPSCEDSVVADCVCATDSFCCNRTWDLTCAGEVTSLGCGTCNTGASGAGGGDGAGGGAAATGCCEASPEPGCSDTTVKDCVCADDPYCCNSTWDSLCVGEIERLGCGTCR